MEQQITIEDVIKVMYAIEQKMDAWIEKLDNDKENDND